MLNIGCTTSSHTFELILEHSLENLWIHSAYVPIANYITVSPAPELAGKVMTNAVAAHV